MTFNGRGGKVCVWWPVWWMGNVFQTIIDNNQSHVTVTLLLPPTGQLDRWASSLERENQKLQEQVCRS